MQTRGSGTDTNYDLEPRPQGSSCCRVYDVQHRHKTSPNLPQDFPRLPMNQSWHQDFPRLPQHFLIMDQSWPQDSPRLPQDFPWTRAGPRISQALPKTSPKLLDVQTASATLTKNRLHVNTCSIAQTPPRPTLLLLGFWPNPAPARMRSPPHLPNQLPTPCPD